MEKITSVNNDLVKQTAKLQQKKYRDIENKFLLEGYKPIFEAFNAGISIEYVFVSDEKINEYNFLGEKVIPATEAVLKKIATTDSAPESVGVAVQKHFSIDDLKNSKKVVLLENIKDAGNLGTILRTSAALGVDAVILFGENVDLYNPKIVRSSVGNLWKIPVVKIKDFSILKETFQNYKRIATLPRAKKYLKNFTAAPPYLIMFGSEADGLSDELVNFSTDAIKIEMEDNVESLNLSISCAIVLYKLLIN